MLGHACCFPCKGLVSKEGVGDHPENDMNPDYRKELAEMDREIREIAQYVPPLPAASGTTMRRDEA